MTVGDLQDELAQYDRDLEVVSLAIDVPAAPGLALSEFVVRPLTGAEGSDGLFQEAPDGRRYLFIG